MRRIVLVVLLLGGLALAVWWVGRGLLPPRLTLPDGATLTIHDAQVGSFESMEPPRDSLFASLLKKLPPAIRNALGPLKPGGRSSGRSYYTYSDQDHALHLWFSVFNDGQPVDPHPLRNQLCLADEQGWLYPSAGWASSGSGEFSYPEQICHSFPAIPRWQRAFRLVLSGDGTNTQRGTLTLENPAYLPNPATNWPVRPLPQEQEIDGHSFQLAALEPEPDRYEYREFQSPSLHGPPRWQATLHSTDANGLEGVWHVIRTSFYDNYLNHSLNGLPPRRSADDALDRLQWQVQFVVAADHRSRSASNFFWKLPPLKLPGPGQYELAGQTNRSMGPLQVRVLALMGPGIATFTNAVLLSMEKLPFAGQGKSSSHSSQGSGSNELHHVKLTRPSPHLVFDVTGPFTNFHYTCRAIGLVTGEERWLGSYSSPRNEPRFQRLHHEGDILEWDCKPLTPDQDYRFVLGVHRHRELNFFVEAPVYSPPDEQE